MKKLFFVLFLLTACAQKPLRQPTGDGLFPFGTYQHEVQIHVNQPARDFNVYGAVKYSAQKLTVVGLSQFSTTLFRIEQELPSGPINKEFYLDVIREHEDQFMRIYSLIRDVLTAPKGKTDFQRNGAHFVVSEPDARGIYRKIQVDHSQFTLRIKVTNYEP